jgi:hypothetical protein
MPIFQPLKKVNKYGIEIVQTEVSLAPLPAQSLSLTVERQFDDLNRKKSGSSFYNNLTYFVCMLNQRLEVQVSVLLR